MDHTFITGRCVYRIRQTAGLDQTQATVDDHPR